MKARAIYRQEIREDGSFIHAIDHDGGGFLVSSEEVGVAVQNFLNKATSTDIQIVHNNLLHMFKIIWAEESELPMDDDDA